MTNMPKAFGTVNGTATMPPAAAKGGSGIDSILSKKNSSKIKTGNNITSAIFKNGTFVLIAISLFSWLMIYFDTQSSNGVFSLFGKTENTYISFQSEERSNQALKTKNTQLRLDAKTKSQQIEDQEYNIYIKTLEAVSAHRIPWFDEYTEDAAGNEELGRYGILDIPDRLSLFFSNLEKINTQKTKNPKEFVELTQKETIWKDEMTGGNLEVTSFSAGRGGVNMGIRVSTSTNGNTFHLANFVKNILNSFNVFKGAEISNYAKTRDDKGNETESMSFSLPLDIQSKGEYDVNDSQFKNYEKFLKKYSLAYFEIKNK